MQMNDDKILNMYLKDIKKIPLLTYEEETELAVKAAAGDKAARDKIVTSNLRFVINVAKKYQNHGLDLVDLISEGNVGLMNAIDRFDVSKGYHFISYAVWWIRQSIINAIGEKGRAIRLPINRVAEVVKINATRKSLQHLMLREEEEIEEIGKSLDMSSEHVREMINLSRELVSLDAEVTKSDSHNALGDFVEDKNTALPENQAMENSMKEEINKALKTLRPNEQKVLKLRFGLNGAKPMSLKEVGEHCNLTRERIRQIEKSAITRMQESERREDLECFIA